MSDIITREDPKIQLFFHLMSKVVIRIESFSRMNKPVLEGEHFLTGDEVCALLRISSRTLQEYRVNGILPYYKMGFGNSKIIYKSSDIHAMLEKCYKK